MKNEFIGKLKAANHIIKLKAFVRTYGCQQNFSDSEKLRGMLKSADFEIVDSCEQADLLIFNTCAVREHAEERVFGNIGQIRHLKKSRSDLTVVVCGCMTAQPHIAEKFRNNYPFVDIVCGTNSLTDMPRLLCELYFGGSLEKSKNGRFFPQIGGETFPLDEEFEEIPSMRESIFKASVPIMYGCNNFCTYCVVPYVRGRERSRNPNRIVSEVSRLVHSGTKYFLLLGQNVNSYSSDGCSFLNLLRKLDSIEGDFIIDFMTSHPKDCSKELIDFMAESEKITHHLHLPFQSGSNKILSEMNRGYTREQYIELVKYAKDKIPLMSVTSDVIVGFPGETEEDFQLTLSLIEEAEIDASYTFLYSKRKGTKASEIYDTTPKEIKQQRFQHLLTLQKTLSDKFYSRYKGKILRILCDGKSRIEQGKKNGYSGKSREGIIVDFISETDRIGEFVKVKINETFNWAVSGEIVI